MEEAKIMKAPTKKEIVSLRERAKELVREIDRCQIELAEILYKVKYHQLWKQWGYKSFNDYVNRELSLRTGKSFYLIQIYQKLIIDAKVKKEEIKEIGWSKVKEIAPIITENNKQELLLKVKQDCVEELSEEVREIKNTIVEENTEPLHIIRFGLYETQYQLWKTAIEKAMKLTNSENMNQIVECILHEFLSGTLEKPEEELKCFLERAERVYNIKLIAIKGEKVVFGRNALKELED